MSKQSNIPQLRFKGFKEEWELNEIGNTCVVKTGGSDTQDRVEDGKYPFFVRSNTVERINKFSFDGEAILTSGDGVGVGKNFHYINGKFDYHQRVYALREFKNGYNGKFIYHFFSEKFYERVIKLSAKNSVDSVRMSMITDMKISIPSLPEQEKIASFLSAGDEKIQQLTHKAALLEQYKKGVMQQLFSGKLRFKDENGEEYADWEEKKLGDVGKFNAGGDLDKLKYSKVKNDEFIYPIYANGSGEGIYGYATTFQYKTNCVTVSGRGNLGYAKMRTQNFNAIVRLIVIEPKDLISPKYLEEIINQTKFAIESTGVPQLTVPQIKNYKIFIPSLPEQQKIAGFLSGIDEKIGVVQGELLKMQGFKKGLLQRMFV